MKILRSEIATLGWFAAWSAFVATIWMIFGGSWPSPYVFIGIGAACVFGRPARRAARGRKGPAQGAGPQVNPGFVWGSYSGETRGSFDVVMHDAGRKKIQVIKVLRQNTGLALRESKDLVDQAPSVVLANVPEDVASAAAATLTAAGAEVFVQYSPRSEGESGA